MFLRMLAGLEDYDGGTVTAPDAPTVVFQEPRLIASKRLQDNVILSQRATRKNREAASAASRGIAGRAHTSLAHNPVWRSSAGGPGPCPCS